MVMSDNGRPGRSAEGNISPELSFSLWTFSQHVKSLIAQGYPMLDTCLHA